MEWTSGSIFWGEAPYPSHRLCCLLGNAMPSGHDSTKGGVLHVILCSMRCQTHQEKTGPVAALVLDITLELVILWT